MSNAIVMNTLTGAVTEYAGFDFHAVTPTHGGSAVGLYAFGGERDVASTIVSEVRTGRTQMGTPVKKRPGCVYFTLPIGTGTGALVVEAAATYEYPVVMRAGLEARGTPGKGIFETLLGFGFKNTAGQDFALDKISVELASSTTRRI